MKPKQIKDTVPTKKDWEEDFNEKFTFGGITGVVAFKEAHPLDVKAFIHTLLATQRRDILKEVRGLKVGFDGILEEGGGRYNQALSDVEKLIENNE